jgi:glutamate-ammonia-ligase adenylyltransferase
MSDGAICPVSICALGKFGGREMGFASDVELMLIYQSRGRTDGARSIRNMEFFDKLVVQLDQMIDARKQGIFEIDLRLRPFGKAGRLGVLLDAFCEYFAVDGPAWNYERQSLVRLRPIAGDAAFGERVVNLRDHMVYNNAAFDARAMRAIREKQIRQLVEGGTINAKFSPGALADLEYLVQGLQIMNGANLPALHQTNTRKALDALRDLGIITAEHFDQLSAAHLFLRRLIEALRMVRGNAKDLTVPAESSEEFFFLARRLDYQYPIAFYDDLMKHTDTVQHINREFFGESEV